jgi:hypothetical protein
MSKPVPLAAGSVKQDGKGGEAETLASEEVIELQAFLERREWIEEKIRVRHCTHISVIWKVKHFDMI